MASNRDKLRSATVGGRKELKKKVVTVNGVDFEVRQLTVGQRRDIVQKATLARPDGGFQINFMEWNVWQVIKGTYVPGTNENVFDEVDYEELMTHPSGGFVEELSIHLDQLNAVKQEDMEKNSVVTPSESSSSS